YLSKQQAALLAAVLPNPRAWNPAKPSTYVARRANWIRQQMWQLGGSHYLNQLQPHWSLGWTDKP
ncbi:MAG: monofunctional biosynthetic peptidoglycan transglycosylase, partial [Pseudomonas sp. PGPPP3]